LNTLGERLRISRDRKGFTQVQVKERTNINNKTLSGYEKDVSEPDTKTLSALADLYEVSYKWLLTGKGDLTDRDPTVEDENYDEEFEEFIKDVRRWYREAPKDKEEDLARLRRIFEAYKDE